MASIQDQVNSFLNKNPKLTAKDLYTLLPKEKKSTLRSAFNRWKINQRIILAAASSSHQAKTPDETEIKETLKLMTDELLLVELYAIISDRHAETGDKLRAIQIAIPLMSKKSMIKTAEDQEQTNFDLRQLGAEPNFSET